MFRDETHTSQNQKVEKTKCTKYSQHRRVDTLHKQAVAVAAMMPLAPLSPASTPKSDPKQCRVITPIDFPEN
jgi:hypothetical protein